MLQQQHQQQQQQHSPNGPRKPEANNHSGVIVAPAEHRIPEYRDHRLTDARDLRIDSNRMDQQQQQQQQPPRDQRMAVRMETPSLSYKPYEQHASARSSASAPSSSRSTRSPSSYPQLHYAPGSGGPGGSHSFSPSPSGRNSTGAANMYMPPPSVSPSRSPAVAASGHAPYPAMRYSPAPAPLPVPSTSPSAASGGHKKSSPSPSQQPGIAYGRQSNPAAAAAAAASGSVQSGSRNPESGQQQMIPLSLITPGKFLSGDSVPPPAHTARSERADVRMYPHPSYSPLTHPLPPPQPMLIQQQQQQQVHPQQVHPQQVHPASKQQQVHPQQQPLDLGTYREDSPIPLISSARLSGSSGDVKKSLPAPIIPSFGGTMMSVAALVDAANAAAASGKSADPAAFVLGLRPPSVTPPLMKMDPALLNPLNPLNPHVKVEVSERVSPPVALQTQPEAQLRKDPSPGPSLPVPPSLPALPALPADAQVKSEPTPPPTNNGNSKPVHKLKTAWLQRHTGNSIKFNSIKYNSIKSNLIKSNIKLIKNTNLQEKDINYSISKFKF